VSVKRNEEDELRNWQPANWPRFDEDEEDETEEDEGPDLSDVFVTYRRRHTGGASSFNRIAYIISEAATRSVRGY
jgi:hypothetical protein